MSTVPDSPRRSSMAAGGNPVKSDPKLIVLMERLDVVDSYEKFDNWKTDFLSRFETFLGEEGSAQARQAYEEFRQARMENVVKKVKKLSDYREKGDLSVERVSVRARNAMNEVSVILIDTCKDVRSLVPPTSADEDRAGYTKYHLGSVLVADGFQEYERLQSCQDIMDKMRDDCVQEIGDEKLLEAIRKYDDEVKRFVSIMEDLGLYKIMLKEREFDPATREKARKARAEAPPAPKVESTIPDLPFLDSDDGVPAASQDDEEYEVVEEIIEEEYDEYTVDETIVESVANEPKPAVDVQPTVQEEPEAEEKDAPQTPPQEKPSPSRKDYDVRGSWGGMPSSPSKLQMQQDLADSSRAKEVSPKVAERPDQVFVTPVRGPRSSASIPLDQISVDLDDDNASVGDLTFTMETAQVLETDTPRTRKAKLDWKSVQSNSKRRGSLSSAQKEKSPNKTGKVKTKGSSGKGPKPPRPTKELTTKTQDKGWNMPMSPGTDGGSVVSRGRPMTKKTETDSDGASIISAGEGSIGPGIKVRRYSKSREPKEATEVKTDTFTTVTTTSQDNQTEIVPGSTTVVHKHTHVTHEPTTTTTHHTNNIEEHHHVHETVHRTIKTTYDTDHVDHHIHHYNTVTHYVNGTDWIGTIPTSTTIQTGRLYVETPGMRRSAYIRMMTFCGVDDSVDPRLLGIINQCYPLVEFAVLMRQDMAGQPRYASPEWIQRLAHVQSKSGSMNLAAHLCGSFVGEVLGGEDGILTRLEEMKFKRVQLNVSSKYGFNTNDVGSHVEKFLEVATKHKDLEIAIQLNDESRPLFIGILGAGNVPDNVTFLFDSSLGRGQVPETWTPAPKGYRVGYAGGIGLGGKVMTRRTLQDILSVGNNKAIWVSMESSLRCTKNGKDVFDIDKCYEIMDVAHDLQIHLHPDFIH